MKRTTVFLLALALLLTAAACHGKMTDVIGVTTLTEKNIVVMNAETGDEFVSGSGKLTVSEGEHIHVEYALDAGSFDLAFHAGDGSLDIFQSADLENLTADGDVFGASGLTGSGSLDLEAPAGEYSVFFSMHEAVGAATVSAAKE